jgi:acyl-CoA synthetase (NDP forming)
MSISGADGVTLQPMVEKGVEVVVGVSSDESFGKTMMFGLGGVFVEVIGDVTFRLIPLTECDAEEMISEIKGYRLIENTDVNSIKELILKISEVVVEENIVEMDLNPIFVYSEGYLVVDARMWIV